MKSDSSWSESSDALKLRSVSKDKRKKRREMRLIKQVEKQRQLKSNAVAAECQKRAESVPLRFPSSVLQRTFSVSLAVAGSILDNAQTAEMRAHLAGQVARAAAIFCVDEVVVFNDQGSAALRPGPQVAGEQKQQLIAPECCIQMSTLLQYMECPQYLRRHLFPVHEHLRHAGLLSPLDCPHHLRRDQRFKFREGIVVAPTGDDADGDEESSCWVDVGLTDPVRVDHRVRCGIRVTVRLPDSAGGCGRLVSPRYVRQKTGVYWGYSVRIADNLSRVFTESPLHPDGYDLLIGTSDRGVPLEQLPGILSGGTEEDLSKFRRALVVFGGLQGLEAALENDDQLTVESPVDLFDAYINACIGQGTRTIRTEEAILITLAGLFPVLTAAKKRAVSSSHTAPEASNSDGAVESAEQEAASPTQSDNREQ